MIHKYKSTSRLGKVFVWLSIALTLAFIITYILEVQGALNMDPNSFNCLHDSMMMQICEDPYGSSVPWTMIKMSILGWPLILAWLAVGVLLLIHPNQLGKTDKLTNEHPNEKSNNAKTKKS